MYQCISLCNILIYTVLIDPITLFTREETEKVSFSTFSSRGFSSFSIFIAQQKFTSLVSQDCCAGRDLTYCSDAFYVVCVRRGVYRYYALLCVHDRAYIHFMHAKFFIHLIYFQRFWAENFLFLPSRRTITMVV